MNIISLKKMIPPSLRFLVKPYFRIFFPNKLIVSWWLTFRCNYTCSYCYIHTKHDFSEQFPKTCEKSPQEWLKILNELPPAMFLIQGGEPFLYNGIHEILDNFPEKHEIIAVITNLSFDPEIYKKLKRKICLTTSFHREHCSKEEFQKKILELSENFNITVNFVATPENIPVIESLENTFKKKNITFHVDPYIDVDFKYSKEQLKLLNKYFKNDNNMKKNIALDSYNFKCCHAGKNYINLLPNGKVYTCTNGMNYNHSPIRKKLLNGQSVEFFDMGNIFDDDFKLNDKPLSCNLPCKDLCDIAHTKISSKK